MATNQELLTEARAAYHDLQLGKAVASARDSNGEEIRYTQANRGDLLAYIRTLETPGAGGALGPLRFRF